MKKVEYRFDNLVKSVPVGQKFRITNAVVIVFLLIGFSTPTLFPNEYLSPVTNHSDEQILVQETRLHRPSTVVDMSSVNLEIFNTPDSFETNTLFHLYQSSKVGLGTTNNAVIMSMNGTVLAQKDLGVHGAANCPVEFIDPNTLLVGTEWGAALWHLGNDSLQILGFAGHHDFEYNPNDKTIFTLRWKYMTIDDIAYRFDYIREYSMTGETVWELDTSTFISTDWWCPSHDMGGSYRDITHSNTVYYDAEDDIIYYNSRNTNTFFKINHSSSEVIWGLGEYGDFDLYSINGNPRDELFYHAHSVEPVNNDTFILFDNDLHSQVDSTPQSRILEIRIDEDTMTANESWYYTASSEYYSAGWGDADRLPNGNRIGDFGYLSGTIGFLEVNEQKEIVWEARITQDSQNAYGSFRLERFRFEPILNPHPDMVSLPPHENITWEAFYNFRNKHPVPGNYTFYINGIPVQTGDFTYSKYWNPTTISINPGHIPAGVYNMTLEISDGYGHNVADSFQFITQNFHIERSGLTTIERGQYDQLPTWSGDTLDPLACNISLNGTIFMSFDWNGTDIILDPELIPLGSHFVEMHLYNGTTNVFDDSFWLNVYPEEPPVIEPLQPLTLETYWSSAMTLSWNLFDASGTSWSLYVNESLTAEDTWTPPTHRIDWDVPLLRAGVYNITLVVEDLQGLVTYSQTSLTVHPPTSPHILSSPGNSTLLWGSIDVLFTWEVFGGTDWIVLKNGHTFAQGEIAGEFVEVPITDWRSEGWRPGEYNLTLVLFLDGQSAVDTIFVTIVVDQGDPYADALVPNRCKWYLFGENSIGAPDGIFTEIYIDYENGYLTLDMGENEEIIDGAGADFTVFAQGDEYEIIVSESFFIPAQSLGVFSGTKSFDISGTGLEYVRYVRIELFMGDIVELDAIEALHYNEPPSDSDPPAIDHPDDIWMYMSDVSTILNWSAFDATPWNYEIYVNSTLVETNWWYGSDISFVFVPASIGVWNITIVFYDAFANIAIDQVLVIVELRIEASSIILAMATLAIVGIGATSAVILLNRKFGNSS